MQSGSTPMMSDPFSGIALPDVEAMKVDLQRQVEAGVISPEEAATIFQEQSAFNQISTDPSLKKNQMDALLGLQDISDSGGMTTSDKANLSRIASDEASSAKGKREAILQNAEQRGMGGSGMQYMDQLLNEQESASRKSQRDLDVAGMAQERALQALMQQGQLAGNIQNQDFSQQAQRAQANDAISRFNAQNQQNQLNTNVGARNNAQAANLSNKQNIMNTNVGLSNQQQMHNKGLLQQDFNNKIAKAGGTLNVNQANQQAQGSNSQGQADAWNKTIGTGIQAGGMFLKEGGLIEGEPTEHDSQPRMLQPGEMVIRKEDVPDMLKKAHTGDDGEFDAAGFLDSITGHKYGYSKKGKK